jgi:hypothetical protein
MSFGEGVQERFPFQYKPFNPGKEKGKVMDNEKSTRDPTRIITLDDTQHVAFLKMRGWKVTPWIESDDLAPTDPNSRRVEFQVEGDPDTINMEMQRFYDDEPFPIQTFCRCLKEIKSAMYNLRRLKSVDYRSVKP